MCGGKYRVSTYRLFIEIVSIRFPVNRHRIEVDFSYRARLRIGRYMPSFLFCSSVSHRTRLPYPIDIDSILGLSYHIHHSFSLSVYRIKVRLSYPSLFFLTIAVSSRTRSLYISNSMSILLRYPSFNILKI